MNELYQRTSIIIGKENIEKLKQSHVIICGLGGVGSYALEALARVGIGKITLIDKDVVDITNINRQIIALNSTIGQDKVKIGMERIKDINPQIIVETLKLHINSNNINEIFNDINISYVVDCVDNIGAKIAIIQKCKEQNIECISCMGMGNKLNPLDIRVNDIYKTTMCPLARIIRKKLKELGINNQKAVYSVEQPIKIMENGCGNLLGSISFVPSTAGLVIASEVVKDIINKN